MMDSPLHQIQMMPEGGGVKRSPATAVVKGPFYLMRSDNTSSHFTAHEMTGATNLMAYRGLEHSYVKLTAKKLRDTLSSFLPHLPGTIDAPGSQDNSSLQSIIDKPPVCGKELLPLNQLQLAGFRLHPGPMPEQYRGWAHTLGRRQQQRHRHKKHRIQKVGPSETVGVVAPDESASITTGEREEKEKRKKHKKHEKDAEERKKRRKEKKRKRNKEDKEA